MANPLDDIQTDLINNALALWDWSPAFPVSGYAGDKGVILTPAFDWQTDQNLIPQQNNQWTKPLISVEPVRIEEMVRTFSDVVGPGASAGLVRYGRRAQPRFLICCWADQELGGMDMARKLGGQVWACLFYNQARLATYRAIRVIDSKDDFVSGAQLWCFCLLVKGNTMISFDA